MTDDEKIDFQKRSLEEESAKILEYFENQPLEIARLRDVCMSDSVPEAQDMEMVKRMAHHQLHRAFLSLLDSGNHG